MADPLYPGSLCTIWSANTLLFVKLGLVFSVRFSFALLFRPNIRAVASRAIFWRGLVEQDEFALDFLLQRMALGAADVCVPARQRELGALIVIKGGGGPILDRMAIR